jgi:hypothetical protein
MFKRLFRSSFSAVLRHSTDSGIQVSGPGVPPGEAETRLGGAEPLANARRDFVEALADIRTQQAGDLLRRIGLARSLRELWFLRTEVFNLVAHHRDQAEANHRMAALSAHFPRQVKHASPSRFSASRT